MPELKNNTDSKYPTHWTPGQIKIMEMIEELHRKIGDASSNIDSNSKGISGKLDEITARLDREIAAVEDVQRRYQ
jgi:hypothetical protein